MDLTPRTKCNLGVSVMCEVGLGYIYAYLSLVGLLCFGVVWGCFSLISWVIEDHTVHGPDSQNKM